ncbi:MAG: hypothetical protein QXT06_03135 [Candidatus Bathyarchaeia archaeon]
MGDVMVPKEKAFYFFTSIGNYTGHSASSLSEFLRKIMEVDAKSLDFHLNRGDFERWFIEVLGNEQLAGAIRSLRDEHVSGESLRVRLHEIVSKYLKGN